MLLNGRRTYVFRVGVLFSRSVIVGKLDIFSHVKCISREPEGEEMNETFLTSEVMNYTMLSFSSAVPSESPTYQVQELATSGRMFDTEGITLEAIGFTLGGGLIISALATIAFGIAVRSRSTVIAPRCTARHPNTIYRSRKDLYKNSKHRKQYLSRERRSSTRESSVSTNQNTQVDQKIFSEAECTPNKSNRGFLASTPLKTAHKTFDKTKKATIKSTTIATKLVTGVDLNSVSAIEQKERKEEEREQKKAFVKNSIGQHVYVGTGARKSRSGSQYSAHSSNVMLGADGNIDYKLCDTSISKNEFFRSVSTNNSNNADNENADEQYNEFTRTEQYVHPQDRGNPFLGWIPWTLSLSYDRMLRGIPGTGTRKGGMEGKLLGVNLDAIVLFRFHDLCLRITALATFICIFIILPLNLSACDLDNVYCSSLPSNANLTNYGRTTIANILYVDDNSNTTEFLLQPTQFHIFSKLFWTNQYLPHLIRMYIISLSTWVITYYTLKSVKKEWRQNLGLRRVYYLEADHYGNRQSELDKTLYDPYGSDSEDEFPVINDQDDDSRSLWTRRAINQGLTPMRKISYKNREPWIPHPEHRDTIPNIELYSVLVGGLPSLPSEVVKSKDMKTAISFSKRASIDWQLAVATTFFDHCVPNQPGFSSSVVAVTILPGAPELAKAWRKWYVAAATLRRLRFIRRVINQKRHYKIDDVENDEESSSSTVRQSHQTLPQSKPRVTFDDSISPTFNNAATRRNNSQYRQSYVYDETNSEVDYRIFRSLNYGPEQQAVYSREMAQGAAACCPNGCCEGRVLSHPIDRLLEMEDATIKSLEKAQYELQCAQMQAAVSIAENADTPKSFSSVNETEIMLQNTEPSVHLPPQRRAFSDTNISFNQEEIPNGAKDLIHLPTFDTALSKSVSAVKDSHDFRSKLLASRIVSDEGDWEPQSLTKAAILKSKEEHLGEIKLRQSTKTCDSECDVQGPQRQSRNLKLHAIVENPDQINNIKSSINHNDIASPDSMVPMSVRGSVLRMTSEGKFLFNSVNSDSDQSSMESTMDKTLAQSITERESSSLQEQSLRRRAQTAQSFKSEAEQTRLSNQWEQVNSILRKDDIEGKPVHSKRKQELETGVWTMPSFRGSLSVIKAHLISLAKAVGRWTKVKTDPLTSKLAKDSTYAVVTFSSRQAAVAARHCLADGRGVQRWLSLETVPVPPLADAAPFDIITCRGCCRPVTLNLNQNQLVLRRYIATAALACIYVFYTIPITAAQNVVDSSKLKVVLPGLYDWIQSTKILSADIISGLISGLLYTTFFALCPVMFKMIANAGSQATSVQEAEKYALQYYWYFMLVTAFVFTGLADAARSIWEFNKDIEQTVEQLFEDIANNTPLMTSATWLNWIIVRTTMTLPLQYMLQINTFFFGCIGWKCCARCTLGGGPGGPIPYRIYIDCGVVFVCVVSLAPQSPLVAPVALLYYVFCTPLWRRNCIFMYRPKFDSGGERWPFLSDILITSLFMGQFLLSLQMALRDAFGPALFAAIPAVPTFMYRNYLIKRFKKAYEDAGLLQTSLLDGWDNTIPSSTEKREEFRRFLVDAHKAAYIPVCIAGGATNILTAEPAVVIPSENDDMLGYSELTTSARADMRINDPYDMSCFSNEALNLHPMKHDSEGIFTSSNLVNRGACMRRTFSFSSNQTPRSSMIQNHMTDSAFPTVEMHKNSALWQKWQKVQNNVGDQPFQEEDSGCTQS